MKKPLPVRRLGALVAAAGLVLAGAATAAADQIVNTIDNSVDSALEQQTITSGDSTVVSFFVLAENDIPEEDVNGCNATGSAPAVVTLAVPANVTASANPIALVGCGASAAVPVTFSSNEPGSYVIPVSGVTGGRTGSLWATGAAAFTLVVNPPLVTNTPPILTLPSDVTAEATGPGGAAVSYTATATDAEDGSLTPTCAPTSGSTFTLGATTVNCTVSDSGALSASGSFTVTVVDTTAPSLSLPANITKEATGPSGAPVTFSATATDLVDGNVDVTCLPLSGSMFPLGTTTVDCAANDSSDNGSTGSFTVTVRDTTAPSVTVPTDITEEATGPTGAAATFSASATDVVDGPITPTCVPPSGSTFPLGGTTVTCSATDAAGNTGFGTFTVTVVDQTPPVITWVGGPADGSSYVFGSVPAPGSCTAVDLVDGSVACDVAGYSSAVGAHTLTATAVDAAGNKAEETRSYTVEPWDLFGFNRPVTMGALNTVKAGSTVPLKFEIFAGETELTETSAITSFTTKQVKCSAPGELVEDAVELVTTGGTSLRYDATEGQFIQNWKTPKNANTCHIVTMTTQDGSSLSALFKLK